MSLCYIQIVIVPYKTQKCGYAFLLLQKLDYHDYYFWNNFLIL